MPTTPDPDARDRRSVVSFVRRGDRMTAMQQRAWDRLRERWVIDVPRATRDTTVADDAPTLDIEGIWGSPGPLWVEIGSGKGDSPVAFATAHPDRHVLAFEVFTPAVAATLALMESADVDNLRLIVADAVEGLDRLVPTGSIAELRTFFPDPWHKTRHHKRRLVNPAFASTVAAKLVPGGRWLIATDWDDYAEHCREVLGAHPDFVDAHPQGAPRDPERPLTRYEQRGIDAGRTITDLVWMRHD